MAKSRKPAHRRGKTGKLNSSRREHRRKAESAEGLRGIHGKGGEHIHLGNAMDLIGALLPAILKPRMTITQEEAIEKLYPSIETAIEDEDCSIERRYLMRRKDYERLKEGLPVVERKSVEAITFKAELFSEADYDNKVSETKTEKP